MNKHRIKIYFTDLTYNTTFARPFTWNKNIKTNRLRGNLIIVKFTIIYR